MASKRASAKKSAKKSSKKSSKKSAKKSTQKLAAAVTPAVGFPLPNLRCILACVTQYNACIKKGVDRETCQTRLQRCILNCMGVRGTTEPGLIDE